MSNKNFEYAILINEEEEEKICLVKKGEGNFQPRDLIKQIIKVAGFRNTAFLLISTLQDFVVGNQYLIAKEFDLVQLVCDLSESYHENFRNQRYSDSGECVPPSKISIENGVVKLRKDEKGWTSTIEFLIDRMIDVLGIHDAVYLFIDELFIFMNNYVINDFIDMMDIYESYFPEGKKPPEGIDGWGYVDEEGYEVFLIYVIMSKKQEDGIHSIGVWSGDKTKENLISEAYLNPENYQAIVEKWERKDKYGNEMYKIRIPVAAPQPVVDIA